MSNKRIYGENIQINPENIREFYNQRAKNINQMGCAYTAVLLNDEEPQHALAWNEFEKKYIQPDINIDSSSIVLDIGCGIGRWAETIIPIAQYYLGVDYSSEMVKTATMRNSGYPKDKYDFRKLSFQEIMEEGQKLYCKKFNRLIIGGVCMYINDDDLKECFSKLDSLLDDKCIIYFTETVALEKRLTLDEFYSEALKTNYDVIYRTPTDYQKYYEGLLEKGFLINKQGYLPKLNKEEKYRETDRYYTILSR